MATRKCGYRRYRGRLPDGAVEGDRREVTEVRSGAPTSRCLAQPLAVNTSSGDSSHLKLLRKPTLRGRRTAPVLRWSYTA